MTLCCLVTIFYIPFRFKRYIYTHTHIYGGGGTLPVWGTSMLIYDSAEIIA